jgi:predicted nucleotidyltransferase
MEPIFERLAPVVERLRERLPSLQAVYLFGSQASGEAGAASDVDLAVLLPAPLSPIRRWELAEELADLLQRDVDLVDLRDASTVLRHQVLEQNTRLWSGGIEADEFELAAFSEYWDLAIQRRELLADIKRRGSIHGR